ncbi:hypothetical protein KAX02_10405 [candidate division WOR-3 bacterium]|nr:hypothetical protein [candidate division WOR-3 bacterium]
MKLKPFLTHEIGSLSKPSWRVKTIRGIPLGDKDIEEAINWGKLLEIEGRDKLLEILIKRRDFKKEEKEEIVYFSSLYATKLIEKTGIDLVYDGEQHRVEMYEYPIKRIKGFIFKGHVRSFDNKYYRKASFIGKPELKEFYHVKEFERISSFAKKPLKIPITGAYTLVDWSYNEYYLKDISPGENNIRKERKGGKSQFLRKMAREIIYPNLQALYQRGAKFLQIDEPAATTKRDEIPELVNTFKESIGDLKGNVFFSTHICFSKYSLLFPEIERLEGILNEVHFEYANRDTIELGVKEKKRKGYKILEKFKDNKFVVGLGVIDVHTNFIEPPELVRDRILYATKIIKDPERIFVAPDCGLRTRRWEIAFKKLRNMVEGKIMAEKEIGI